MKDWWLRTGCFLTGYNYSIVKACSEVTAKEVKRYASALIIVSILWIFVGYTFANRYLGAGLWGSLGGATILWIIIIQIERQIILTLNPSKGLYIFRAMIAILMAIIGSVIIDQIMLKEDIEQYKAEHVNEKVDEILPKEAKELNIQINKLDSAIMKKEYERQNLQADIQRNPMIQAVTVNRVPVAVTSSTTDSSGVTRSNQHIVNTSSVSTSSVPNPNIALLAAIDTTLNQLRRDKIVKDSILLNLRPEITVRVLARKGFLDEIEVMANIMSNSPRALIVWLIWFFILMCIELFILFSKIGEKDNDYQFMVKHQMKMHLHKLKLLEPKDGFVSPDIS